MRNIATEPNNQGQVKHVTWHTK